MVSQFGRSILVCSGAMAVATGCIGYKAESLPMQGYNSVLANRTTLDANVAATTSITLPEAERVALYLNPQLRAARQAANVKAVDAERAGAWDDPVLSGDVMRLLNHARHRWTLGGALMFSLPISGRLHVEKEHARADSREAVVRAWGEEQRILHELRASWTEWSAARSARGVLSNEQARYDNASGYAEPRVRDGKFAATEASMLRVSRSQVLLDDARLGSAEEQARIRIVGLMGLPHEYDIQLVQSPTVPDWSGNPDDIYLQNPEVLLREAQYEVAEQALRLEVRKQFPDISLGPVFTRSDSNESLGLGFSVPIPILNGNRGNIAHAEAQRESARANWEAAVEQAFNDYAVALTARDRARQRADSARSAIPSTESQVGDSRSRLESSDYSTLLLVDSFGNERRTKLTLADAEAAAAYENAALWYIIPAEAPAVRPR